MPGDYVDKPTRIVSRQRTPLSPWVSLDTVSVAGTEAPEKVEVFHALHQADYVHVLPMTSSGSFILVRQYRPVIESWTLELRGGLRDAGETPGATAARELKEETGFEAVELIPLIDCHADVGRLSNRFYGFFAVVRPVTEPEKGISPVLLTGEELRETAAEGRIASADHVGLLYLAAVHPQVQKLCHQFCYTAPPWI